MKRRIVGPWTAWDYESATIEQLERRLERIEHARVLKKIGVLQYAFIDQAYGSTVRALKFKREQQ